MRVGCIADNRLLEIFGTLVKGIRRRCRPQKRWAYAMNELFRM